MIQTPRSLPSDSSRPVRAIMSLGAAAVLFVGIPVVLVAAARARFERSNPLGGVRAPWTWSRDDVDAAVRRPIEDDSLVDLILRACLLTAWLAVSVIAITTVLEFVHLVRHRGVASPRRRGLGWAQGIARFLATGLVAVLPLASPAAAGERLEDASMLHGLQAASPGETERGPGALDEFVPRVEADGGLAVSPARTPSGDPAERNEVTDRTRARATHRVQRGESVWAIAAALGDGTEAGTLRVADAILEINLGRSMNDGVVFDNPALIQPGWELELPEGVGATTAAVYGGVVAESPEQERDRAAVGDSRYRVKAGDTLSSIAEQLLGDADRWFEIFEANRNAVMPDGRALDEPDLIVPGWELEIPQIAAGGDDREPESTDTGGPTAAEVAAVDDGDADDDDGADRPDAHVDDADIAADEDDDFWSIEPAATGDITSADADTEHAGGTDVDDAGVEADEDDDFWSFEPAATGDVASGLGSDAAPSVAGDVPVAPSSVPSWASSTTSSVVPVGNNAASTVDPADSIRSTAPAPLSVGHAALLAGGVITLLGVRRRRRLRAALPRARVPDPPPSVAATERVLRNVDAAERVMRVDVAVRAVARHLVGTGVRIGLVTVTDDGTVTMRVTGPTSLPAPWEREGGRWTLPGSIPIELLADDARESGAPCPALVHLGNDADGGMVLLDLEAVGVTAIDAPREQADAVVRSIGANLAASITAETAHLIGVGLDASTFLDHPNAVLVDDLDSAIDEATRPDASARR